MEPRTVRTSVLIIGGGATATRAALAASDAGADAVLISKGPIGKSGATPMAGGGAAAPALGDPRDNADAYFVDHIAGGRGLADPELARALADDAAARVRELFDYGALFIKREGKLSLSKNPGHSYARSIRATRGGVGIITPLRKALHGRSNIRIYEDMMAFRLLVSPDGARGALALDLHSGEPVLFLAPATILATGGYQDLYPISDAAPDSTGDGFALAYRAGATLTDMEMLLFYPTVLVYPHSARGLVISYEQYIDPNAFDAHLVDAAGVDLLAGGDLPLRDEMARFVFDAIKAGRGTEHGGVYIDLSKSRLSEEEQWRAIRLRWPANFTFLEKLGLPVVKSRLEVGPAAHYTLGGVKINAHCETDVPGLFAAGEVSGNLHGANRLAGNALAETLVFGYRAAHSALRFAADAPPSASAAGALEEGLEELHHLIEPKAAPRDPLDVKQAIREAMLRYCGPNRDAAGLAHGIEVMEGIVAEELPCLYSPASPSAYSKPLLASMEARLMAETALLVLRSALAREESRGHHYRTDFPGEAPGPTTHTIIQAVAGRAQTTREPVVRSEGNV